MMQSMRKMWRKKSHVIGCLRCAVTVLLLTAGFVASAQDSIKSSMLYVPLVYDSYATDTVHPIPDAGNGPYRLDAGDKWLQNAIKESQRVGSMRQRVMIANPQLTRYNAGSLPAAPPEGIIPADPHQGMLTIAPPTVAVPDEASPVNTPSLRVHNWLHVFNASLQFTQAYISGNWYQGGENNMALLGTINWNCNLNQDVHPNWLFNNAVTYKLGVATTHGDSIRNYIINEDNFLYSSQLGYKAIKHWYYSAMLKFTTQFMNNYKSNTRTMTASFLSPGELNLGLGMTYDLKKADDRMLTLAIAPMSYNLKICRNIDDLDPVNFGIAAGHHTKSTFGSNVEAKLQWRCSRNIMLSSRVYLFTNYEYVQGDWENTIDMSINKYLTTQVYTHLRYDKSHPWDVDWKYWQFKEILSLGIIYRFATIN